MIALYWLNGAFGDLSMHAKGCGFGPPWKNIPVMNTYICLFSVWV